MTKIKETPPKKKEALERALKQNILKRKQQQRARAKKQGA